MHYGMLSDAIVRFVTPRTEAIVTRFFPALHVPGFFAGYRTGSFEAADLIHLLSRLHRLGVTRIAGQPITEAIRVLLRQLEGAPGDAFHSYQVAETLLDFGPFESNSLLDDFTDVETARVREAVTATAALHEARTDKLAGFASEDWAALARCEYARQRLGLLDDKTVLEHALAATSEALLRAPAEFVDDDGARGDFCDVRSVDTYLVAEPMWELFELQRLRDSLRRHIDLAETLAMENGAALLCGRCAGALSVASTLERCAVGLRYGLSRNRARSVGLMENALEHLSRSFADDLVDARRYHGGRCGAPRSLHTSLDGLARCCAAAEHLQHCPRETPTPAGLLFPDVDQLVRFDETGSGVWMFRNDRIAFQLPLAGARSSADSDWIAWPQSPSFLEAPVDPQMICGAPRVARSGAEFTSAGCPARVRKTRGGLELEWHGFRCNSNRETRSLAGKRTVIFRAEGDTLHVRERWVFDEPPDALTFDIAEAERPLHVAIRAPGELHRHVVTVEGMPEWRGRWGKLRKVHQLQPRPSREVEFELSLRPLLRVTLSSASADYSRSLADTTSGVVKRQLNRAGRRADMSVAEIAHDTDILHLAWPEYLFMQTSETVAEFDERYAAFIDEIGRSDVLVVWTMHNRLPHEWEAERGRELYRRWAKVIDGAIHHSEWGMRLMREELPFKPAAKHVVIPHGHFGEIMKTAQTRAEIEHEMRLRPARVRFGVLGRSQKDKQVDMIVRAFVAGADEDDQLVVSAYDETTFRPDDSRVVFLPRERWLSRSAVARHGKLCDALVSAHKGETYLTSGTYADSVGLGIPLVAPDWSFFREILGDAAFFHDNTEESLAALFGCLAPTQIEQGKEAARALQPRYAWPQIAARTAEFYRSLGVKRR